MEESGDQINDEVVVDAALEDLSVTTASESEMSSNDQVVSIEVGETNNAVTQFVGDSIHLNTVCIHGNTPTQWVGSKSPRQHHLCHIHRQQQLSPGRS